MSTASEKWARATNDMRTVRFYVANIVDVCLCGPMTIFIGFFSLSRNISFELLKGQIAKHIEEVEEKQSAKKHMTEK